MPEFDDAEFDEETVEEIEAQAVSEEALARPSPRFGPQADRDVPVILAADDDSELRQLLRERFDSMESEFLEASDGAETLEQVIVHKPDLVVLDVMMPELNGWEVCKYIREHDELENVGVVMLTGIGSTNNELTSPLFGADDYVDKPFDFEELAFKVRKVLSERRPEDGPELDA